MIDIHAFLEELACLYSEIEAGLEWLSQYVGFNFVLLEDTNPF